MNVKLNLVINEIEPLNNEIEPPILNKTIKNLTDDELIKTLNKNKYVNQVIFTFNKTNDKTYNHLEMLAIDKPSGNGKKLYLGFKLKADKLKFIQSHKYNNIYEILTNDSVKPYYDIDYKSKNEHKTDEEVKQILNRFISELNEFYRIPITSENLYVYAKRDDETKKIKSIHIVVSGFQTTKETLKIFVTTINKQRKKNSFKKLVGGIDGSVYNHNKLFSLPHQRKLGKTEYFEWFYCFDNDETKYGDNAIEHYLINDVKNCVFNDYYDNSEKYVEIIQNKILMKDKVDEKLEKTITTDVAIRVNASNIVDILLDHLPPEFYHSHIWTHISRQIVLNGFTGYQKWLDQSELKAPDNIGKNDAWADKLNDKFITTNLTKHLAILNNEYDKCFVWDKTGNFSPAIMTWICKVAGITETDLILAIKRFNEINSKSKKKDGNEIPVGNNYNFIINNTALINEIKPSINWFSKDTNFNNLYTLGVLDVGSGATTDLTRGLGAPTTLTPLANQTETASQTNEVRVVGAPKPQARVVRTHKPSQYKTIKQADISDEMIKFLNSRHKICGMRMLWGSGKSRYGVSAIVWWANAEKEEVKFARLERERKNPKLKRVNNNTVKKRILNLTMSRNLNMEMTATCGGISHLDINEGKYTKEEVGKALIVHTTLESLATTLWYNDGVPFEIVVADEYESLINGFISTTFKKKTAFEVSVLLRDLLCSAEKVICLDCDMSDIRMNLINTAIGDKMSERWNIQYYKCDYNSWANYKYILHTAVKQMRLSLYDDVFTKNKRVIYASNSFIDAKSIFSEIKRKSIKQKVNKNIMIISGDCVEYYVDGELYNPQIIADLIKDKAETTCSKELIEINKRLEIGKYATSDKKLLFQNMEDTLKLLKIEILIYSPSITCGISFGNSKTDFMFDKVYASSSVGSITPREFAQMIHRCRNLQDEEINIYIKNGLTPLTPFISLASCEEAFLRHLLLKLRDTTDTRDDWMGLIDVEKFKDDRFYRQIIVSNMYEKFNAERNYIQELIGKLTTHGMNVSIKHIFKLNESDIATSITDTYNESKKLETVDKKLLLQQEPKITQSDYNLFKDDTNRNDGVDNRMKVRKFFTLKSLNINKSNSKKMREEYASQAERQKDGYGRSSGIFTNNATDADGNIHYYTNYTVNRYFVIRKPNCDTEAIFLGTHAHTTRATLPNLGGAATFPPLLVSGGFKTMNEVSVVGTRKPQPLKNYNDIRNGDEVYHYGGDETSFNEYENDKKNNTNNYCDLDNIYVDDCDNDLLIQHSKKLTDIYKSPHTERLYRLNNDILTGKIINPDDKSHALVLKDFNINKIDIIKFTIDRLGIDRTSLIYKRKILSNLELKTILQTNATFIETQLLTYYNKYMDSENINETKIDIKKYSSDNKKHFNYVKSIIISYLGWIGITHNHYDKNGKRGRYVNNDECLNAFQYELYGKDTFINTYYDTIPNEIYYYLNKSQKIILNTISQKTLDANMTDISLYKRVDRQFQTRRDIVYQRNNHITIKLQNEKNTRQLKLPFNLLTAHKIENPIDSVGNVSTTLIKDFTDTERIDIYLNLINANKEQDNENNKRVEGDDGFQYPIESHDITHYKKHNHDIRFYSYKDIGWKQTDDKTYKKEQVVKYTPYKNNAIDNEFTISETPITIVADTLNEIIDIIDYNSIFKTIVNTEIKIGGEIDMIKVAHDKMLREEIDTTQPNSNDNYFNVLRPSIKLGGLGCP